MLKYVYRGRLGDGQRDAFFHFLDALAQICTEECPDCDKLEQELNVALAKLERFFPRSIFVSLFHFVFVF